MMKKRLSDTDMDGLMAGAIRYEGDASIKQSNLIIVELLNRLLEKK